jgi:hypothetical protein
VKRELAGIPLWIWGVGAAVVVGGYLWIRHSSGGKSGQGQTTPGVPVVVGGGSSSFMEWIKQHQGSPTPAPKPPTTGPERQWLIHKTGSQHPWTFLHQHHERIVVGPDGSRKIVSA